jgi:tetratricopeptide (TPR) repeat protein
MTKRLRFGCRLVPLMLAAGALPCVALAQSAPRAQTPPGAIVQPLPAAAAVERLNSNLSRLSRSPQDVNALIGAGQAALDLGDVQAANGFFTRANMVDPRQGKAKLGLAIVSLALKQPKDAAAYFDEAQALGEPANDHLAERGLAYDLTGQQAKAQADYRAALARAPSDRETAMRYAVSLGIGGDVTGAERQLEAALAAGDREAWRNRAFILAMNGRVNDARGITQSTMPKGLADALDPYIQRIALLTPAQRAAAVHFGAFPADVLQRPAPAANQAVQMASRTDSRRSRNRRGSEATPTTPTGTPAPAPSVTPPPPAVVAASTPPAVARQVVNVQPATAPTLKPEPKPVVQAQAPAQAVVMPPPSSPVASQPTVAVIEPPPAVADIMPSPAAAPVTSPDSSPPSIAVSAATVQGPAAPASVSTPLPSPAGPQIVRSLADIIADVDVSEGSTPSVAAVDLAAVARLQAERRKADAKVAADKAKKEAAAKAKAEAAAKAKAEAEEKARIARNPARIWVQIATGRDVSALAFDLRRMRKNYGDAIGDMGGWSAEWGATRRLLIGPYSSSAKAKAAVSDIKQSGGDAFVFQSEAGEEVTKLGGK